MMIRIRTIKKMDEFKKLPEIEKQAWGFRDLEVEPHYLMTRAQKYGGLVQGLFLEKECIGFTFALLAKWRKEYFMYSHMTAVAPQHQGRGYGFLLKKAQREAVLDMGLSVMRWNFDPLESLNGFFNLHRLGITCAEYERNIYGKGESGLHEGLETDRLIAHWQLDSERVRNRISGKKPVDRERINSREIESFQGKTAYIEIPADIRELKRLDGKQALKWRNRTRDRFETAFTAGFTVDGFVFLSGTDRVFYKLKRD